MCLLCWYLLKIGGDIRIGVVLDLVSDQDADLLDLVLGEAGFGLEALLDKASIYLLRLGCVKV